MSTGCARWTHTSHTDVHEQQACNLSSTKNSVTWTQAQLIHVKVTLEDPLLEGVGNARLGHLTGRRLHGGNALGTLVLLLLLERLLVGGRAVQRMGTRHGRTLRAGAERFSKIESFAWMQKQRC
jgi:hypothetical protein